MELDIEKIRQDLEKEDQVVLLKSVGNFQILWKFFLRNKHPSWFLD